jgi:hypothetical protein
MIPKKTPTDDAAMAYPRLSAAAKQRVLQELAQEFALNNLRALRRIEGEEG